MEDSSSHHRRNCVVNPNANANLLLQATSFGYPEMAAVLAAQQLASSHVQHTMVNSGQQQDEDDPLPSSSRGGGRTRSGDSKSSSAYASRHQQAEARRRNRINERLESLRRLVPHAERANTATFLEEVIKYIQVLQSRNANLERMIREIQQQGGLPGDQAGAGMAEAAAAAAAAAAGGLMMPFQAGLSGQLPINPLAAQPQQQLQQLPARSGSAAGRAHSGSLGALQDSLAQQQDYAAGPFGSSSPAAALLLQQQQHMQAADAAAQSGAAALLAAAGATAAMATGVTGSGGTGHRKSSPAATATSSGGDERGGAGPSSARPSSARPSGLTAGPTAAAGASQAGAAAASAGDAAAKAGAVPCATVQVPDMLQSLLPQGLDLQQMLQQALLSTQAQLLAQLQQHHHQQTASGTAGAAAGNGGSTAAGTVATNSGATSGQPATSTAPLSALQQHSLSAGQQHHQGPSSGQPQQQQQPQPQQQQQLPVVSMGYQALPSSLGLLASPPSLVLPSGTAAAAAAEQPAHAGAAVSAQQLLQPAPALNITLHHQQQQPGASGEQQLGLPAAGAGLQEPGMLAINQIMAQLRGSSSSGAAPAAEAGPSASAPQGFTAGHGGPAAKALSPSATAALSQGESPARRAAVVTAAGAFSGGDGTGPSGGGGGLSALPNLLAMAPPAGVLEARSGSMSGEQDGDGAAAHALKKRKMLVL